MGQFRSGGLLVGGRPFYLPALERGCGEAQPQVRSCKGALRLGFATAAVQSMYFCVDLAPPSPGGELPIASTPALLESAVTSGLFS